MSLQHGLLRMLNEDEIVDLRREMQAASAWMRAELLRRHSVPVPEQQAPTTDHIDHDEKLTASL